MPHPAIRIPGLPIRICHDIYNKRIRLHTDIACRYFYFSAYKNVWHGTKLATEIHTTVPTRPAVYLDHIILMSSLRFTTLVGGDCSPSHLIELDLGPDQNPVVLLLDCGWEEPFAVESLEPIIR